MPVPKLEVHRPSVGGHLLPRMKTDILWLSPTDEPEVVVKLTRRPVLPLNSPAAIAEFILQHQRIRMTILSLMMH